MALTWYDKSQVSMLSTVHDAFTVDTAKTDRSGNTIAKPRVILEYNQYMGGVDKLDQMLEPYVSTRKSLYYQLFTILVPYVDYSFPVVYALTERKMTAPHKAVLEKVKELFPDFQPSQVIADFEEAPTAALHEVFGDQLTVSGCWFHCAQGLMKRLKNIGLRNYSLTHSTPTTLWLSIIFHVYLETNWMWAPAFLHTWGFY